MSFRVYFLKDSNNNLYIGQTNSLHRREKEQLSKNSKTAKFIKDNEDFKPVYYEKYATRTEAMQREIQLKKWSRAKKEALINHNLNLLQKL